MHGHVLEPGIRCRLSALAIGQTMSPGHLPGNQPLLLPSAERRVVHVERGDIVIFGTSVSDVNVARWSGRVRTSPS